MLNFELMTVVEGRGVLRILLVLRGGVQRYAEVQRASGLHAQLLTTRLRALEAQGLIQHRQVSMAPPHTEYQVTSLGQDIATLLLVIHARLKDAWADR